MPFIEACQLDHAPNRLSRMKDKNDITKREPLNWMRLASVSTKLLLSFGARYFRYGSRKTRPAIDKCMPLTNQLPLSTVSSLGQSRYCRFPAFPSWSTTVQMQLTFTPPSNKSLAPLHHRYRSFRSLTQGRKGQSHFPNHH